MYKATEKQFFKMLMSGKDIETHLYCEDNLIYCWENYNLTSDKLELYYLVSPATRKKYDDYIKKFEKQYPLLFELV